MRPPRHVLFASIVAALVVLTATGCGDPVADRVGADDGRSQASFGADDRIAVRAEAARLESIDEDANPVTVELRAALPWPRVEIDNGTADTTTLTLRFVGISSSGRLRPTLRGLTPGARRDPRCPSAREDRSTALADLTRIDDPVDPNVVTTRVVVPPCAGLSIDVGLAAGTDSVDLVFVGSAEGRLGWLADAIAAAEAIDADMLYVIGGADDTEGDPYDGVAELAATASIPVALGIGRADRAFAASWRQRFAPANNHVRIGDVDLVTLDATDGRIDDRQRGLIADLGRGQRVGLAVMSTPPFDPGGVERYGWRSPIQAAAFVELLASRGFDVLVGSSHRADAERRVGGIRLVNLAGARDDQRTWLRITIDTPVASIPPCDADTPCTGGQRCVGGWCRPPCDADGACAGSLACDPAQNVCRPACGTACEADACTPAGWCIDTPQLTVAREGFSAPQVASP